ncbi:MAG TPA: acetate/propionate family kinase [Fibrobacteria bacterium]|nr:acetate/propionate family kinase [Fibrobacteria bacterium]
MRILTVNGGSSSIKFALFEEGVGSRRVLAGAVEGIGSPSPCLWFREGTPGRETRAPIAAGDHEAAVEVLMDWVQEHLPGDALAAVGHRVVHGGAAYGMPEFVTPEMVDDLVRLSPFDPEHLPEEILLTRAFHRRFPKLPQVACFDTEFHRDMPPVARRLAIPRRFDSLGIRRYGFHGLSYQFLMEELARLDAPLAKTGRVVLAHLGSGASLAVVHAGQPLDTTMGFTPAAGIPMATRSGDLDPGLPRFLSRSTGMDGKAFDHMIHFESGLLGISETSSDMRELLLKSGEDERCAQAVDIFCYQIRKCIGAYAAAAGGLDALVFSGGIGENSPEIRARVCEGLGFLGIDLDPERNLENAGLISSDSGRVAVRMIRTDEEMMIARSVSRLLGTTRGKMEVST